MEANGPKVFFRFLLLPFAICTLPFAVLFSDSRSD
jgi:hypothetical protein